MGKNQAEKKDKECTDKEQFIFSNSVIMEAILLSVTFEEMPKSGRDGGQKTGERTLQQKSQQMQRPRGGRQLAYSKNSQKASMNGVK